MKKWVVIDVVVIAETVIVVLTTFVAEEIVAIVGECADLIIVVDLILDCVVRIIAMDVMILFLLYYFGQLEI